MLHYRPISRVRAARACVRRRKRASFTNANTMIAMKKFLHLVPLLFAARLCAADAPAGPARETAGSTNSPSPKKEAAAIPDATHKPVFTTNTVTIAGQRVAYIAETGMLPILSPPAPFARRSFTSPTRGSLTKSETERAARHVLFQRRSRLVVRLAAPRRVRPAPREDERRRHAAAAAVRPGGQRVFHPRRERSGVH